MTRRVVVAISESGPWHQCGIRRRSTEQPKSAPRYATVTIRFTCMATGAISLAGSHDRMEAKEPGRRGARQGRTPVEPVARSASLDGPPAVR
jgi:hypothetical protein